MPRSPLQLLDKLDKDTLQSAFVNEEALRSRSTAPGSTSVLSASTPAPANATPCEFCTIPGYTIAPCHRMEREKDRATQEVAEC